MNYITQSRRAPWIILLGAILLTSCSSTNSVSFQILEPAEINLPQHIRRVVIVNRSLPEKQDMWKNILEGFLTQENIRGDAEASSLCINSLASELNANPRVTAITRNDHSLKGTGTQKFPPALNWAIVQQTCKDYQADALVALESYDTDLALTQGKRDVKKKQNDREVVVPEYTATLQLEVHAGWRVYDPINQTITDERRYTDAQSFSGQGDHPEQALKKIPSKRQALNQAGNYAGTMYGKRISPNWINAHRRYYIRKDEGFKQAKLMARAGNWEGAAEIWSRLTRSSDPETSARAMYNMAVAAEMAGNLDAALDWAGKAVRERNFKPAYSYQSILQSRLEKETRLDLQLDRK